MAFLGSDTRPLILKLGQPIWALMALILLGFLLLLLFLIPAQDSQRQQEIIASMAELEAAAVNRQLESTRQRIAALAKRPELRTILTQQDSDAINQQQRLLAQALPEAISVKLIPLSDLGIANLDYDQHKLRNNIELDLIRRASQGELHAPESYPHQNQVLLSFAQAVPYGSSADVVGAMLVTMSGPYLQHLLHDDHTQSKKSLYQTFGNKRSLITEVGMGGSTEAAAEVALNEDQWRLVVAPSQQQLTQLSTQTTAITLLGVMTVLGLAVIPLFQFYFAAPHMMQARRNPEANEEWHDLDFDQLDHPVLAPDSEGIPAPKAPPAPAEAPPIPAVQPKPAPISAEGMPPAHIFRAYDIRGVASSELNHQNVVAIGRAIGTLAERRHQPTLIVARDGRTSSDAIRDALIEGLNMAGRDVIDIGRLPTPLLYFATHTLESQSGVMITGSHNPAEDNGLKIVIDGKPLTAAEIQGLYRCISSNQFASGQGSCRDANVLPAYIDYIANDIAIQKPLKVVLDAGNGIAGAVAPTLFTELGCEVIPLYCEVDGRFPNHHPDPSIAENLVDLVARVKAEQADLGLAFDGDGDRVGVVTAEGEIVPADRLLMLLAEDLLAQNAGASVLFDIKCTRLLPSLIKTAGGQPIMWKSGHSFMKQKMAETGALLGGELSGHIFYKERWFGFDDGLYAAARLLEVISLRDQSLQQLLAHYPVAPSTPEIKVAASDENKFSITQKLAKKGDFGDGKVTTLDGVRVDFNDGWGLVRASNTTPALILRFEAENSEALTRIQSLFKEQLKAIDPNLKFSF